MISRMLQRLYLSPCLSGLASSEQLRRTRQKKLVLVFDLDAQLTLLHVAAVGFSSSLEASVRNKGSHLGYS